MISTEDNIISTEDNTDTEDNHDPGLLSQSGIPDTKEIMIRDHKRLLILSSQEITDTKDNGNHICNRYSRN
jgi:hypothetical protein